jgi:hypothetical protein
MRCPILCLAASLCLSLAGVALAEPAMPAPNPTAAVPATPAKPSASAEERAKASDQQKVCFDDRDTGSRMSHRVCMTRKEYEARQRDS